MIAPFRIISIPASSGAVTNKNPFTIVAIDSSQCSDGAIELKSRRHVWNSHWISFVEVDEESYGIEIVPVEYS